MNAAMERLDPARGATRAQPAAVELAVVVPTLNEAANVLELHRRLGAVLGGRLRWEMVVVDDDSADGTPDLVEAAAQAGANLRCLRRIGRRGLSSAVIEGCLATAAPRIVVMDADLQHDEAIVPAMLERLDEADLVVGTRYALGGSAGEWTRSRRASSTLATRVARFATGTTLSDPMSGFFAMRRSAFLEGVRGLSGSGFKILLDIVCSAPRPLRIAEVPFTFRPREAGESKLSLTVVFDYVGLIAEKRTGGWLPARFALFAFVGTLGIAVHMLALYALNRVAGLEFVAAQVGAVLVAMTFNFLLDNRVTYGDRRLRGGAAVATGLLRFYLVCGIGAVSNIGVSAFLFAAGPGWFASGLAGAFVAAVFNYAMSNRFVWRGRRWARRAGDARAPGSAAASAGTRTAAPTTFR